MDQVKELEVQVSGGGNGFSKKAVRSLLFQAVGKAGGKGGKAKGGKGGKAKVPIGPWNNWNTNTQFQWPKSKFNKAQQNPPKDNGGKGKGKGKGKKKW